MFNAEQLSNLLSAASMSPAAAIDSARAIATMLRLPLVLDAVDAERVLKAGAHRLRAFRRTSALFS